MAKADVQSKTIKDIINVINGSEEHNFNDEKWLRSRIQTVVQGFKIILTTIQSDKVFDLKIILDWIKVYMDCVNNAPSDNIRLKSAINKSLCAVITYIIGCCDHQSNSIDDYQWQVLQMLSKLLDKTPANVFDKLTKYIDAISVLWSLIIKCKEYRTQKLVLVCVSKILQQFKAKSGLIDRFFQLIQVNSYKSHCFLLKHLLLTPDATTNYSQDCREFLKFINFQLLSTSPSVYSFRCKRISFENSFQMNETDDKPEIWMNLNFGPKTLSFDSDIRDEDVSVKIKELEMTNDLLQVFYEPLTESSSKSGVIIGLLKTSKFIKCVLHSDAAQYLQKNSQLLSFFNPNANIDCGKINLKLPEPPVSQENVNDVTSEVHSQPNDPANGSNVQNTELIEIEQDHSTNCESLASATTIDTEVASKPAQAVPPETDDTNSKQNEVEAITDDVFKVPSLSKYRNALEKLQDLSEKNELDEEEPSTTPAPLTVPNKTVTSKERRFFKNIVPGDVLKLDEPEVSNKKRGRKRKQPTTKTKAPQTKLRERKVSIVEPLSVVPTLITNSQHSDVNTVNSDIIAPVPTRSISSSQADIVDLDQEQDTITIDLTEDSQNNSDVILLPSLHLGGSTSNVYELDYESEAAVGQSYRNYLKIRVLKPKKLTKVSSRASNAREKSTRGKKQSSLELGDIITLTDDIELPTTSSKAAKRNKRKEAPTIINISDSDSEGIFTGKSKSRKRLLTADVKIEKDEKPCFPKMPRLEGVNTNDHIEEKVEVNNLKTVKSEPNPTNIEEIWSYNAIMPKTIEKTTPTASANNQEKIVKNLEDIYAKNDELFQQLSTNDEFSEDDDKTAEPPISFSVLQCLEPTQSSEGSTIRERQNLDSINSQQLSENIQDECILYRERSDSESSDDEYEALSNRSDADLDGDTTSKRRQSNSSSFDGRDYNKTSEEVVPENVETSSFCAKNITTTKTGNTFVENTNEKSLSIRKISQRTILDVSMTKTVQTTQNKSPKPQGDNNLETAMEVDEDLMARNITDTSSNNRHENVNESNISKEAAVKRTEQSNMTKGTNIALTSESIASPDLFINNSSTSATTAATTSSGAASSRQQSVDHNFASIFPEINVNSYSVSHAVNQQHSVYNSILKETYVRKPTVQYLKNNYEREVVKTAKKLVSDYKTSDTEGNNRHLKMDEMKVRFSRMLKFAQESYETAGRQFANALKQIKENENTISKIVNDFDSFQKDLNEESRFYKNNEQQWNQKLHDEYEQLQDQFEAYANALRANQWNGHLHEKVKNFLQTAYFVSRI